MRNLKTTNDEKAVEFRKELKELLRKHRALVLSEVWPNGNIITVIFEKEDTEYLICRGNTFGADDL